MNSLSASAAKPLNIFSRSSFLQFASLFKILTLSGILFPWRPIENGALFAYTLDGFSRPPAEAAAPDKWVAPQSAPLPR
jgi:hypothetical protein